MGGEKTDKLKPPDVAIGVALLYDGDDPNRADHITDLMTWFGI